MLIQSLEKWRSWFLSEPTRWLRPALVVGLLIISVAVPLIGSQQLLQLSILGIVGITGLLLLWEMPELGILLTMLGGITVPITLAGGLNVAMLGIAGLLGLWLVEMIIVRRKISVLSSRTIPPLLLFVVITFVAFLVGQLPWFFFASPAPISAQLGGVLVFVLCVAAFLLVAHRIKEIRWLKWLTYSFVALAGLHILGWVIPGVGPLTNPLYQNGTVNNAMFWVWLVSLASSQALINNKLSIGYRVALGGIALLTIFVSFFWNSGWKSGYLPIFAAVAAILCLRYWRLGLAMIVGSYFPTWYLVTQAISSDTYSFDTRVDAFSIMLQVIKKNPILGVGPANYYWYVPLYRIRGYVSVFSSHNQYLDILAQTGILGFVCVLWFFGEVGWLGWRLCNQVPEGFAQAYVYGALGGLVGTIASGALADWFLPFVYNIGFNGFRASILPWLFLGGLVSLTQIYPISSNAIKVAK